MMLTGSKMLQIGGWGCSSVVECLLSMCGALSLIPSIAKIKGIHWVTVCSYVTAEVYMVSCLWI
jgi:hypothetical protein